MPSQGEGTGALFIVGTGPGAPDLLTARAEAAIRSSRYVIGNSLYIGQIQHLLEGKEVIESSMGSEVERAKEAVKLARYSRVSIVSGGDPGVYGMAGIVLEVLERSGSEIPFEVVPGITAATAAAALAGSPLTGDFVVLSLSDLLTPWVVIEKRLHAAFSMKIPVVLYNPRSRARKERLSTAIGIARGYLGDETPVACARDVSRKGEAIRITTLERFEELENLVDMHSIVIIGGEESYIWREKEHERIITRRGYQRKYSY
ncbi:MAG: precorrin-3B C(17)-methyltransferase [Methanomicrobiales archaeon]|nr:precorrin-3B C(17)-methyltransferase [Methanomicrobiales archaeon]